MKKLAIVTTHPIQYNAPLFKRIAARGETDVHVFYTWGQAKDKVYDPGFGKEREWDIPLLEGYRYSFVENVASRPGSHHFNGIINPSLIHEIEAYDPDALFVFGWSFKSHLQVLRHFHGKKPVLFRGDSTLLDEKSGFSFKKILRTIFLRRVYRHVDYALYAGEANKAYFLRNGLKEDQLIFAPHAIDNSRFFDSDGKYATAAKKWRTSLAIGEEDIVFLFAGKLEAKKHPDLLLRAFMSLPDTHARLIIIGDGELGPALKELARGDQRVVFLPFQNQSVMPVVYRLGAIFVLPSRGPGETWGLAVNEAMACGRAVVVSDKCGCARDLVKPGVNGYVFQAGDVAALTNILNEILMNRTFINEMGRAGATLIRDWRFELSADALTALLTRIKS